MVSRADHVAVVSQHKIGAASNATRAIEKPAGALQASDDAISDRWKTHSHWKEAEDGGDGDGCGPSCCRRRRH